MKKVRDCGIENRNLTDYEYDVCISFCPAAGREGLVGTVTPFCCLEKVEEKGADTAAAVCL